jgi:antitoxin component YwqK of YwqJK toxin-antitoxin module
MYHKILKALLLLLIPLSVSAQSETTINRTDNTGKKQGHWIKRYPDNTVMYEGFFRDNHPEGEFKRYSADGSLRSVLVYSTNGREAEARIYHPNGFIASEGRYRDQKKEGVWKFYSEFVEGYLVSEETYSGNLRNGRSVKLYPDGTVAEKMDFVNDTAQGEWIKLFPDSTMCLKTSITDGKINGKFEAWYENGNLHFLGEYKNDKREGTWYIYDKNGQQKYRLEYVNGITNDKQMDIDTSDFLDSLEQNKGKVPDPEKTGNIW